MRGAEDQGQAERLCATTVVPEGSMLAILAVACKAACSPLYPAQPTSVCSSSGTNGAGKKREWNIFGSIGASHSD